MTAQYAAVAAADVSKHESQVMLEEAVALFSIVGDRWEGPRSAGFVIIGAPPQHARTALLLVLIVEGVPAVDALPSASWVFGSLRGVVLGWPGGPVPFLKIAFPKK